LSAGGGFDIHYSIFDIYPPPEDSLFQCFFFRFECTLTAGGYPEPGTDPFRQGKIFESVIGWDLKKL
jgi:hypothetical protein